MACVITDTIVKFDNANVPNPVPYVTITAAPATVPIFVKASSVFQEGSAFLPRTVATDSNGTYSFTLPWPSEQDPASTKWIITLPDNSKWMGSLPEGISGPLTIHDLKELYGWGLVSATNKNLVPVAIQASPISKVKAGEVALSTTAATNIITFTPTIQDNYLVLVFYRVVNATTNLTITLTYTDGSGPTTSNIVPAATPVAVGSYSSIPTFINVTTSLMTISAQAGTANNVFVSASILGA